MENYLSNFNNNRLKETLSLAQYTRSDKNIKIFWKVSLLNLINVVSSLHHLVSLYKEESICDERCYNMSPWCSIVGATVTVHQFFFYFTFLSHLYPLPCGTGSTVPREGFDSSVIMLVCCDCDTSYIVSVHIECQTFIYTLSLCRGHSWRVRLAKQETLTPPGTWSHLWFVGVCECPLGCSMVGATVTVHQIFCILHLERKCNQEVTGWLLVTGCNQNDLDIWTDWCRLGLQFIVYKSAEQEW